MKHLRYRTGLGIVVGIAFLGLAAGQADAAVINVLDHGAVGDATTLNSASFKKPVAACLKNDGGTIFVPAGVYRTGPVQLQSNVTIRLEAGAVLRGSDDVADYQAEGRRRRPLIWAENATNVTICGPGQIDGCGTTFMQLDRPRTATRDFERHFSRQGDDFMSSEFGTADGPVTYRSRPNRLIAFYNCKHVSIRDVLVTDAPCWTINFADCEYVDVDGVTVLNNLLVPNSKCHFR
jgi:polygalacturonase